MKSFEAISGPKVDHWLVNTVGALLAVTGIALLQASKGRGPDAALRTLAVGQAAALTAVDVLYSSRHRISKVYLLDAIAELILIGAWLSRPLTR